MPKASKGKKFYAVQKGRQIGVFLTWEDCEKQTKGYPGAKYQSFANAADAEAFVSGTLSKDHVSTAPSTSSSSVLVALNSKGKKRAFSSDVADEYGYDVVYCDGACKGNGQAGSIAGVGVWWEENDPRNIAERCPGDQTNNRAELIAIVRMLETTPKSKRPLLIKTDSQYCIKCFLQWLPKWERNNFRTAGGRPVKNLEIIIYVSALLEARALVGQPVRLEYVKGHSGDRGNDGADAQANKGALLPPVPERDWTKAKQELLEQLEEESRLSESQPISVPLNANGGALEQSTNQPRKVRKVSHDPPSSTLSLAPISTELSNSENLSTNSLAAPSLPSPLPIIEVSSSPPRDIRPSQTQTTPSTAVASDYAQAELEPEKTKVAPVMDSQPSKGEPSKSPRAPKTPLRKHGVGLFTTTPPPNAHIVRKFSTLPREPKGAKKSQSDPQDQENNDELMAMRVYVEDDDSSSESVSQDQEANEEQMIMNANAANVDLNEATKSESVAQDQRENEKSTAMSVDAVDDDLIGATKSNSVPKDQEINEKPIVDSADIGVIEAKEAKSVPKGRAETGKSKAINEDASDVEEADGSELVSMEKEEAEIFMAINKDVADISVEEAKDLEPVLNEHKKTEKPMVMSLSAADVDPIAGVSESKSVPKDQEKADTATGSTELEVVPDQEKIERPAEKLVSMSVDASDVDLNDYLDCVDDDDAFDDL